ncbi:MAG: hypothetical protein HC897_01550 [Thermoanaerobaculia bacterium]|nr:hypothetical protein [Thermoanaerobaculia bacterium]
MQPRTATILLALTLATPAIARMTSPPASRGAAVAPIAEVDARTLAALDTKALLDAAEKGDRVRVGGPFVFAEARPVAFDLESSGTWETLSDGSRLWRLLIESPGAVNLNLAFRRFELPEGARLWIYNKAGDYVEGPYTTRDRSQTGELWTPVVYGSQAVVELHVPAGSTAPLALEIGQVNHGFRSISAKQGSCNVDVVCPEGEPWRDQIRSAVRYSISGIFLCSGTLINNTAEDGKPFVLSAAHCGANTGNAGTIVTYWMFESPSCGQLAGGDPSNNQVGATFRASHTPTDTFLYELNQTPDPDFEPYYSGWDRTGALPSGVVTIHHPSWDEKAISFDDDSLSVADVSAFGGPMVSWQTQWDQGTTESGSSGGGLWRTSNGLLVGALWGGAASCAAPTQPDYFGPFHLAWAGGGTSSTRLSDWLDPSGSGATTLEGLDPLSNCTVTDTALCLNERRFKVEVAWKNFLDETGSGQRAPGGTADSGLFYFFQPDNLELLVKVINGCSVNGHFWILGAATTNVEYTLTITDTETDVVRTYFNPLGKASPAIIDIEAFETCP